MPSESLLKALTTAGIGSRRQLAEIIKAGRVAVNGRIAEAFSQPIDRRNDFITLDGKPVTFAPARTVYLMLNKPKDILSTTADRRAERTVLDLVPDKYHNLRLYPVGRLDKDSTGLILLTNDGEMTYRLTHPRYEHEKEYLVRIEDLLSPADLDQLKKGIKLEDGWTHPARVRLVKSAPRYTYSVIIHEGRKRQIRRMFAQLRHYVNSLQRIRIGTLTLGNLREGRVRELTPHEVNKLMKK
jgi:23S rRNA pseudouridine2605 synthase